MSVRWSPIVLANFRDKEPDEEFAQPASPATSSPAKPRRARAAKKRRRR